MSPTFNRNSEIQRYDRRDMIKIHNGIMFVFYPVLPQVNDLSKHGLRRQLLQWLFEGATLSDGDEQNFFRSKILVAVQTRDVLTPK